MSDEKSDVSQAFEQGRDAKDGKDIVDKKTPDMIKNHRLEPEYTPDWDTSEIDREHFERGSQKDIDKYKQTQLPW